MPSDLEFHLAAFDIAAHFYMLAHPTAVDEFKKALRRAVGPAHGLSLEAAKALLIKDLTESAEQIKNAPR